MVKDSQSWTNSKIKGQIGEVIFEELFINLGFLVVKTGQEHTARPITQIERFIKQCGGDFKLDRKAEDHIELDYVRKLPDFLIVDGKGRVDLIEVKFRRKGELNKDKLKSLELYPMSDIFLISLNDDKIFQMYSLEDGKLKVLEIRDWLKQEYNLENEDVISKFEGIAKDWYGNK